MSLSLYDTKARAVREFLPIVPGKVGIYLCGPTVQGAPHLGHLRSALVYDQLRRWLTFTGHQVTLVRNVTDIDDKVLEKSKAAGEDWWALAYRFELEFNRAYSALMISPPTYEPRATSAIAEMISLIERLIAAGYAYVAEDESANVYFSAAKWKKYGELTNQKISDMDADVDADPRGKREPNDFALWKAAKPSEPASASWASLFGMGRPGWHIECSAMATKYLGSHFDIHGGGIDLRFPHHENELAQSSAVGDEFANYWLHNGLVNVAGSKMSKSLGNSIFSAELLSSGSAIALRYYLGSAHYRSVLDYHEGGITEAESALARIETFIRRATRRLSETKFAKERSVELLTPLEISALLPKDFISAMNDDLAIPAALAALHESVRAGNASLDDEDLGSAATALEAVEAMSEVLGINPITWAKSATTSSSAAISLSTAMNSLVLSLITERDKARATKDFARSDAIRDQLQAAGIVLEDAADGTNWSVS